MTQASARTAPAAIDRRALRRAYGRPVRPPADDSVTREVAGRMAERLDYVRIAPARVLDAGCGRGADLTALAARYPEAEVIGVDLNRVAGQALARPGWLTRWLGRSGGPLTLRADHDRLPLPPGSVDLLWSNLALGWSPDPLATFSEWHRVLGEGGLLVFSTWGPDTLREVREACERLDESGRVHDFIDMHDLADQMAMAGFADPVVDMERITLTYASLEDLASDLRASGQSGARLDRPRGLIGRTRWQALAQAMRSRPDGRLGVTLELVQGHAWKLGPAPRADGRSVVRFMSRPGR
jgi:malonyl-CoA O-methyltransferase